MDQIAVRFTFEKETPGTARYQEVVPDGEDPSVGTLYVKKATWNQLGKPADLAVTIGAAG